MMDWTVDIRNMKRSDLGFASRCTSMEGWKSETRQVFEGFLAYDPGGCFVAEESGKRTGFCIAVSYGTSGFFGELIVLKQARGQGTGRILLDHSIRYLEEKGALSIYLDGVLRAVTLYERAGFRKICRSLRFGGRIEGRADPSIRPMQAGDFHAVSGLDLRIFGADRKFFLKRALALFPELCKVQEEEGKITGFIMARRSPSLVYVGPWVSKKHSTKPEALLLTLALENPFQDLRMGVLETNVRAVKIMRSLGWKPDTRSPWRMVYGEPGNPGSSGISIAVGSPAKG